MQHAIAYYRVSTARQGRSGLGIEAQRDAVTRFAAAEGFEIVGEFVEIDTGKGADALDRRPQLAAALACRAKRCPVIVAKLARLSRDVAFVAGLMPTPGPCSLAMSPMSRSVRISFFPEACRSILSGVESAALTPDRENA